MKAFLRRAAAIAVSLLLLVTSASALTVDEARELLEQNYLRDLPAGAYAVETLDELFALVGDPYTYYMTAEEYQAFLDSVEGTTQVTGIGVSVQYTDQGILVVDVLRGGGALDVGMQPGDLIVAIEGAPCVPAGESHRALLVGEAGTYVSITVLRQGEYLDFTIERRLVTINNTDTDLLGGEIGYIDCDSFGSDTGSLFSDGLLEYGGDARLWLVDVRSNSGGYTNSAIESIGLFAGPGFYLYLRSRSGDLYYYMYNSFAYTDLPVIVLTDNGSASASEILASGIRDTNRGIVVGSRTYGKGVAQQVYDQDTHGEYFDGDALKVTVYRFFAGSGNTTDQIGVIPTLLVPDEYTYEIALALSGDPGLPADGRVMLLLSNQAFYLDPDAASPEALSALFSALPPSAMLFTGQGEDGWALVTIRDAAAHLGVQYTGRSFTDLGASPYADALNTLACYDILRGDGTGLFLPDETLTRGQLCAMLAQLLDLHYTGEQLFSDVPDSIWYAEPVNAMAELGLVEGVGGGLFQPERVLTQQEYATILGRIARFLNFAVDDYARQLRDGELEAPDPEALAGLEPWAANEVAALLWAGGAALNNDLSMLHPALGGLDPWAPILREEAGGCLYQMLAVLGILTV